MIDVEVRSRIKMTSNKRDALQRKHYEIQEIRVLETRKNLEKKHHIGYQNQKKANNPKKGQIEGRSQNNNNNNNRRTKIERKKRTMNKEKK